MEVDIKEVRSLIEDGYVNQDALRARASALTTFQRSVLEDFWNRSRGQMKMTYVQIFGYYPSYSSGPTNLKFLIAEVEHMADFGLVEVKQGKTEGHTRYGLTLLGQLMMHTLFGELKVEAQSSNSISADLGMIELYDSMTNEQLFESTQPPRPGRVLPPDIVLKRLDPNRVTGWMNDKGYDYDDELMDKLYDLDDFEGVSE